MRLVVLLGFATVVAGCGAGNSHDADDDDDISMGDGDADSDGDGDGDGDGDSDGDADGDADSDGDGDGDLELPGIGRTWTVPVEIDIDMACESTPCAGPELRFAGGGMRGHCAAGTGWEADFVIANCGDRPTPAATMLAFFYGPAGVDPARDATILTAGLIPRGLAAREAVEIYFVLTDEEWSTAQGEEGWMFIDPFDSVTECFEETNVESGQPVPYECRR